MLIWMRGEPRENEARAPMTPNGAADMVAKGWRVVVEDAADRCIPTASYRDVGCEIVEN
jgi:saccharopine dehydrogenase (NAD+, L-lysine-forming)